MFVAVAVCFSLVSKWQEVVRGFRAGMPSGRRRVKMMKAVDGAFSGTEAVEWLLNYLQGLGKFNSVSRSQARGYRISLIGDWTSISLFDESCHVTIMWLSCDFDLCRVTLVVCSVMSHDTMHTMSCYTIVV